MLHTTSSARQTWPTMQGKDKGTVMAENIIPFTPSSTKLFNGIFPQYLWLEANLDPDEYEVFTSRQKELLSTVAQEPAVIDLFSALMRKHNDFVRAHHWQQNDLYLDCVDLSTMGFITLWGYLQGYESITQWQEHINQDVRSKATIYTMLQQALHPAMNYTYLYMLRSWYCWCTLLNDAFKYAWDEVDGKQAALDLLKLLKYLQPWTRGKDQEYHGSILNNLGCDFQVRFKTPRFTTLMLNLAVLESTSLNAAAEPHPEKYLHGYRFLDSTNLRYLVYGISTDSPDITVSMQMLLDALKRNGLALSQALLLCSGSRAQAAAVVPLILKAGAQYFMITPQEDYPDVEERTATKLQSEFPQCQTVYTYLGNVFKHSDFSSEKQIRAAYNEERTAPSVFITSVDVTDRDEANKLVCALSENCLGFIIDECEGMLRKFTQEQSEEEAHHEIEAIVSEAAGLAHIKADFERFVQKKMRAELKQDKHAYKQQPTPEGVAEALKDDDIFLHFFALYCKPLLKSIRSRALPTVHNDKPQS